MPKTESLGTISSTVLVAQQILQKEALDAFVNALNARHPCKGGGGSELRGAGGAIVHLDTLALEEGIHQLQAPFHASRLDIRICRHGFMQLIHLAHWQR